MTTTGHELPQLCDAHAGAIWAWLKGFTRSSGELPPSAVLYEELAYLGRQRCEGACQHVCEAPAIAAGQRRGGMEV